MKYIGAGLMWAMSALIGASIASRLKMRKKFFEQMLIFLNSMKMDIEYLRMPVYDIIEKYADESSLNLLIFLKKCREQIRNGDDFPVAWEKAFFDGYIYKSEEKEKMLQLGKILGSSDAQGQLNMISLYENMFGSYSDKAKSSSEKYGYMSLMLGILLGCTVFIILSA